MAGLKNKTQKNFTMISNNILRDNKLRMTDRGTLCTICSLLDGWNFSVAGLSAIVPDGKSALSSSLKRLEEIGYLRRKTIHGKQGKFETEIEVINKTKYPWAVVKSQFLKLRYEHIAAILNRIVDSNLEIRNMSAYLVSSLYNQSLVGTIEKEASISDDYLKSLRGQPY